MNYLMLLARDVWKRATIYSTAQQQEKPSDKHNFKILLNENLLKCIFYLLFIYLFIKWLKLVKLTKYMNL